MKQILCDHCGAVLHIKDEYKNSIGKYLVTDQDKDFIIRVEIRRRFRDLTEASGWLERGYDLCGDCQIKLIEMISKHNDA
jgi:hypothetical protein